MFSGPLIEGEGSIAMFGKKNNAAVSVDGKKHLLPRELRPGHPDAKILNGVGKSAAIVATICAIVTGAISFLGRLDDAYVQAKND